MKKLLLISLIFLTLTGCATSPTAKPVCWQNAVFSAIVIKAELGYDTRIAWARSERLKAGHAQAQAFYEGAWRWITPGMTFVEITNIADPGWRKGTPWGKMGYMSKEDAMKLWGD